MKNMRLISGMAVSAIIVSVLIFNSCSKQELTEQTAMRKQEVKMSEQDIAVYNKIMSFKQKIEYIQEHPEYKSGETTTVDSAVWYLDATLNLAHAFISWESLSDFYHDSVFVTISINSGTVSYSDLASAYAELRQKVADVCSLAPGSEKELYIASMTKKSENDNSITIKAEATIGSKKPPPDWHPFEHGWMYGDLQGDAPGPNPYVGLADACTELRDKTNDFRYLYVDDEQMLYISTPNEEPYVTIYSEDPIFINENDPTPGDNYYERLLVYQEQSIGYHDMINEDEMNWYYHKLNYVIYNMVPNNVQEWPNAYGKTFIMVLDDPPPDGTYGTKDWEYYIIRHQYKIEYRIGIYVGDKTEPESIVEN